MKIRMQIVVGLALAVLTSDLRAVELHVSPNGRDDNLGTAESPLASFAGAKARVRVVKSKSAGADHRDLPRGHLPATRDPRLRPRRLGHRNRSHHLQSGSW